MDTNQFKFLMYRAADENVSVNAVIKDETIWLTQKAMAELFGVESHTINYHLKEIFKTQELMEETTTRKIRAVQQEGSRQVERDLLFYNLDAIISVGYRVNSRRATQFRIWATNILIHLAFVIIRRTKTKVLFKRQRYSNWFAKCD